MTLFCRFLHDKDRADLGFKPRSQNPVWEGRKPNPPEAVNLASKPERIGQGKQWPALRNMPSMNKLLLNVNGKKAYDAILKPPAGWLNTDDKPDSLTWGGNLGEIDLVQGDWHRLKALAVDMVLDADQLKMTYQTHPQFIQKFTAVRKDGNGFLKLANGLDAYSLLLKWPDLGLWAHKSQIELFPPLGPVTVTAVGAEPMNGDLHIRAAPSHSGAVIGGLVYGDSVTILEYACRAGDVWGRIEYLDPGLDTWICLQQQSGYKVNFFTTWNMKTAPPI